jgi:hypothetical protein
MQYERQKEEEVFDFMMEAGPYIRPLFRRDMSTFCGIRGSTG